tara:strand:+ start:6357 stop:6989 length:633 start_codon:yes stop_codon:yes gene_type:complete
MSFKCIANCIEVNDIKSTTKLVLIMLANYADENNQTFPSKKHLAKICNCDDRTVTRCLLELEQKKYIKKETRFIDGRQTSNLYTIKIKDLGGANLSPSPTTNMSPQYTIIKDTKEVIKKKSNGRNEYSEEFEEFWKLYPDSDHKTKKDKTFIEWKKYPDKQQLKKFLNNYIQRKGGRFIHNPYNWFKDKVYLNYKSDIIKEQKTKNSLAG